MKVITPIITGSAHVNHNDFTTPLVAGAYNAAFSYSKGAIVGDTTSGLVYISLIDGNLGNLPSSWPTFWKSISYNAIAWSSGTTYTALNSYASDNGRTYQSLQAGNLNKDPTDPANSAWWLDVGPSNDQAIFDTLRSSQAVATNTSVMVEITPNTRVDSVAVLNVLADSVEIQVYNTDLSITYLDTTVKLISRTVIDGFSYFFAAFVQASDVLITGIPQDTACHVVVRFARTTALIMCGDIVLGTAFSIGAIQYGATDAVLNFSTIEQDAFGNTVLIPRREIPKTNQTVWADKANVAAIRLMREALNAVPAVWSGLDDNADGYFPSLLIKGIYTNFEIDLAYTDKAVLTLELEEV